MKSASPAQTFLVPFLVAVAARALLVALVLRLEPGCDLASYASAADGRQVLAMAEAWRGNLDAARQAQFFKGLRASGGVGSSHLIRFFMAPAVVAASVALGMATPLAATVPFWLFAATAAGLTGAWLQEARAGVLVAMAPPILLYSTSFSDATGWLAASGVAVVLCVREERWLTAGVAGAIACWARPEGVFLILAAAVAGRRNIAALSRLLLGAAAVGAVSAAVVAVHTGPLLAQVFRGHGGETPAFLDWPGRALVLGATSPAAPAWKLPYVAIHLVLLLGACWLLVRRARATGVDGSPRQRREAAVLLVWVGLQTTFLLCLRGTQGFDDLPRYAGLCFPAVVGAFLPLLPRGQTVIAAIGAACLAVATVPARKDTRPECQPAGAAAPVSGGVLR